MHDWITAWNGYGMIYCLKYPKKHAKLAEHLKAVREIKYGKGNWERYDVHLGDGNMEHKC